MVIPGKDLDRRRLREAATCKQDHHQDRIDTYFHVPAVNFHQGIVQPRCQHNAKKMHAGVSTSLPPRRSVELPPPLALSGIQSSISLARRAIRSGPGNRRLITAFDYLSNLRGKDRRNGIHLERKTSSTVAVVAHRRFGATKVANSRSHVFTKRSQRVIKTAKKFLAATVPNSTGPSVTPGLSLGNVKF